MTSTLSSLPDHERELLQRIPTQLLIGGQWRDASGGATAAVEDPATGLELAQVADATPADGMAALDAATAAQSAMAALSRASAARFCSAPRS